jgi:hypothetical protein
MRQALRRCAASFEDHLYHLFVADSPRAYRCGVSWCYGPGKRRITLIAITPHP